MYEIVFLAILGFFLMSAFCCLAIAKKNGRSAILAFFMGLIFPFISIIVYLVIGKNPILPIRCARIMI